MQYFLEIAIAKEVLAGLTALELAARQATALGFSRRIAPHRTPFNSHGRPAFTDGSRYISRDVDAHSGGAWKMFDRRGRRLGTYNEDLTVRIGD
ncbi:MAG: toxin C-terminal domain-containing protein [Sandaracinaceae bacterium]